MNILVRRQVAAIKTTLNLGQPATCNSQPSTPMSNNIKTPQPCHRTRQIHSPPAKSFSQFSGQPAIALPFITLDKNSQTHFHKLMVKAGLQKAFMHEGAHPLRPVTG